MPGMLVTRGLREKTAMRAGRDKTQMVEAITIADIPPRAVTCPRRHTRKDAMSQRRKRTERVPQWIRERKPPPHPQAFQQFVDRIPTPTCCPRHRADLEMLREIVAAPAQACFMCGAQPCAVHNMRRYFSP